MAKYRNALPQLNGDWFLTEGGIETTLVFDKGIDLPQFASFPLLDSPAGREMLRDCLRPYFELERGEQMRAWYAGGPKFFRIGE